MIDTYYIGGSPCSGKSTVAEKIAEQNGWYYFKVDDFLEKYTELGASRNYEICRKQMELSSEQIWMREPMVQCCEEIRFYEEIADFIEADLKQIKDCTAIITEGAAYLPAIMKKRQVSMNRYISIVPTKEFQVFHYQQREWIPYVLEGCSDMETAFANWMERDALFAEEVKQQCDQEGYLSIVNNGSLSIEEIEHMVFAHFGLEQ